MAMVSSVSSPPPPSASCCWGSISGKSNQDGLGILSHTQPMCVGQKLYSCYRRPGVLGPDYPNPSNHRMVGSMSGEASQEKQCMAPAQHPLIEQRNHSRKWATIPHSPGLSSGTEVLPSRRAGHWTSHRNAALPEGLSLFGDRVWGS